MELQGELIEVFDTQEVTATFKKREFAIKTSGEYPQEIGLEVTQDKVDLLDTFEVGDNITASVNLRGRKWTNPEGVNKYFNTIQAWRIVKQDGDSQPNQPQEEGLDNIPF